jgi:glutaredoxin 3
MAQIKMYTTPWCGYCTAAKRLFSQKGIEYEDIDVMGDREKRAWLVKVTGRTSVPQIFIDGVAVGGFDDINALDRKGELDTMLGI